jgi:AraC-like DNA-binding protein
MALPAEKICLWNSRALFVGTLPDLDVHQQAAALVCVGIDGHFLLKRETGDWTTVRSALVSAQVAHALKPGGITCAFLFFDPDNADYEYLLASNGAADRADIVIGLREEPRLLRALAALADAASETALCMALAELELSGHRATGSTQPDKRIQTVMRRLISEPGEAIPIEQLAREVHISPSRLAHLFKDQVGVPVRMFRTWYRLKSAVVHLREGMTLTEAALRAGFYDSAHFTNTFRETFGLSPSAIFGSSRQLHWYVGEQKLALTG